jgi:hypothetical protein
MQKNSASVEGGAIIIEESEGVITYSYSNFSFNSAGLGGSTSFDT